jgi:hypothetical protein
MLNKYCLRFLGIVAFAIFCSCAAGQSGTATAETQVWPEIDGHLQLPSQFRVLTFAGLEKAVDFPYQQWYTAAALGYQFKPILKPHVRNIDPDKEYYFVFGGGYEFLRTTQSGGVSNENRVTIDATPGIRLPAEFLARDRSWVEFRWVNGKYSTTYRNMLTIERQFLVHGVRFSLYGSAEAFYDGAKRSWNQEWYTAGVQWPYKQLFMLDTYYRRENCDTCRPTNWNVGGVTLNFYLGKSR